MPAPLEDGLTPVVGAATRLLVLGSFPGRASLAARQYYAHPRNQFWPIVGTLLGAPLPDWTYPERLEWVRSRGLGLWDVYLRCRRVGSLDTNIEDAERGDLAALTRRLPRLAVIVHNGGESARALALTRTLAPHALQLPSTSPAHASWSFERKLAAWREAFVLAGLVP